MEGSGFGSGSVHVMTDPDADPGGTKTYGSYRSGSRSTTLLGSVNYV
jgi:hypothetical protein